MTLAIFGIDSSQEHETGTRSIVTLPGVQEPLLEALAATGGAILQDTLGTEASVPQMLAGVFFTGTSRT